ncbi:MAG TPA: peptidoglycan editing factor PgeF [Terriglobales bacterium]|nr:peptidoglycan editing factor PgeF [Terriglobales bacterium]
MPTTTKATETQPAILLAENFSGIPWLVHGFSTRRPPSPGGQHEKRGADFNLGLIEGANKAGVERNRRLFLRALIGGRPARPWTLVTARQAHSDVAHHIRRTPARPLALTGDGLITKAPGLLLAIKTADCLPVLIVDVKHKAVGAFHAGWRGTAARVVEKGVGAMRRAFGSRAPDLRAAIGPGIHVCCYEVGEEVREKFESQFAYAAELFRENFEVDPVRQKYPMLFMNQRAPGHAEVSRQIHLDLVEANRRQLLHAGLAAENISASPLCTACRTDLLFSHRREHGRAGRMMAAIGIR